jgi:hypothetical protein
MIYLYQRPNRKNFKFSFKFTLNVFLDKTTFKFIYKFLVITLNYSLEKN